MATRKDNRNDQAISLSKGQVIRLETESDSLVPVASLPTHPAAKRTKPSGGPADTSKTFEALITALTTLSGQLERERARADQAEAALTEARAAAKAAIEEATALRQDLQRRRSKGLERLGRLVRAWEGE